MTLSPGAPVRDDEGVTSSGNSDPPEVELVFEADFGPVPDDAEIVAVPITGPDGEQLPEWSGHLVGHDRLADVVEGVSATLEQMRDHRREARARNTGAARETSLLPERVAQVVQGTQVDLGSVLALLASGLATPALELDESPPDTERGMAVYEGRLRMPGPLPRRRVVLRVYPTASANLTVLELLPRHPWVRQTRTYLRAGVPAITDLTDRIEAAVQGG